MSSNPHPHRCVTRPTHISDIGIDLLAYEILIQTPAITIGVCRCVCHDWWSMLSANDIVTAYNRRFMLGYDQRLLLIRKASASTFSIEYDPHIGLTDKVVSLPFTALFRKMVVLTTLDGLVCGYINRPTWFVIWNPTTCKSTTLPRTTRRGAFKQPGDVVGLYFHPSQEYRLLHVKRQRGNLWAYTFSPMNNNWHRIASVNESKKFNKLPKWSHGTYHEGVLYFTLSTQDPPGTHLVAFDVHTEKLQEEAMPPISPDAMTTSLLTIAGNLHMITENNYPFRTITLWKKGTLSWTQIWALPNSPVSLEVSSLTYHPLLCKFYFLHMSSHLTAVDASVEDNICTKRLHVYDGLKGIFYHESLVSPTL